MPIPTRPTRSADISGPRLRERIDGCHDALESRHRDGGMDRQRQALAGCDFGDGKVDSSLERRETVIRYWVEHARPDVVLVAQCCRQAHAIIGDADGVLVIHVHSPPGYGRWHDALEVIGQEGCILLTLLRPSR